MRVALIEAPWCRDKRAACPFLDCQYAREEGELVYVCTNESIPQPRTLETGARDRMTWHPVRHPACLVRRPGVLEVRVAPVAEERAVWAEVVEKFRVGLIGSEEAMELLNTEEG